MISKACVVGAYQRKLEEIANCEDIDLTVVVPPRWGNTELERAHTDGYRMLVEPIRFNGNFHLHYYPSLPQRIREIKPDIVHMDEEPYNLSTYLALRSARRHKATTLFFSWQNILRRYPPPFSWLERWVLKHTDYALVGNHEALSVWAQKGYHGETSVIPQFGVDPDIFSPKEQEPDRKPFVVGFAGRIVPEKGLDILIKAMVHFPGDWQLRLFGDGPAIDELRTLAGLWNHGGSVLFEQPISSTAMPGWYHQLDALVLPSRTNTNWKEQFGRVLIEAMACGVPVIGASSGAIPEVIGEAGLTFPEGDQKALLAALAALYDKPNLRKKLAHLGRERVLAHFTQKIVAQHTAEVYRRMMEP